ncbi:MAG: 3'-5' exonuclease, partial [Candidatus Latescibacteria bacterium]|nr:3'-5' exonuclease [Candidatus Latescibacterota bacterium]
RDLPEGATEHGRVREALVDAARDLMARSQACQARRGSIDFDGLLSRARDLLRDHAGVRDHYRRQFRYVHLDEFQDVDGVQAELVRLLCGFDGEGVRKEPPRLFVVGDPQQSIYRFRGADVDQFARMERAIRERGGLSLRLSHCFRSQADLVGFYNHAFSRLLVPPEGLAADSRVSYSPIDPYRGGDPEAPAVEFLFSATDAPVAEARAQEAAALARRLREMIDSGKPHVWDREGDGEATRGPEARDMAILFRAMTDVGIYEGALREFGIPFYTVAGSGFFGRQEVLDVLNVLRLLTQPRDPLSLAAVLRSPWVGCSDAALFWIARVEAWENLSSPALRDRLDPEDAGRLEAFRGWFAPIYRHRDRLTVVELIGELLHRTHYRSALSVQPEGRQALGNLRKLLDVARQFESGSESTLHAFVRHLEMRMAHSPREAESALEVETGDTAKLMSIHQAKGLEWSVVAVADLNRDFLMPQGNLLSDPSAGMGIRLRNEELAMEAGEDYDRVKEALDLLELAEQQRLLYVAMTRARDRLLLSGSYDPTKLQSGKGGKDSWLRWIGDLYPIDGSPVTYPVNGSELPVRVAKPADAAPRPTGRGMTCEELSAAVEAELAKAPASSGDVLDDLRPPPPDASGVRMAVTDLEMFVVCPRRYQLRRLLLFPEPAGAAELSEEDVDAPDSTSAASLGSLVHEVLNGLPDDTTPEGIRALTREAADRWNKEGAEITRGVEGEAVRLLEAWLETDRWTNVQSSSGRESEVPFHLRLPDGASITGRFDLVYRDAEGRWNVLDYKTSRVDGAPEEHVRTYYE